LLLDYTLWWWHRLTTSRRRSGDSTSCITPIAIWMSSPRSISFRRMALAAFFRAAQVNSRRRSRRARLWQRMLLVSILFHHSNLRLPETVERELVRLIVTPECTASIIR